MLDDDTKALFVNALLVAHADGTFDALERDFMRRLIDKLTIDTATARRWYLELKSGNLDFRPIDDPYARSEALRAAVGAAAADGRFDAREKTALRSLGKVLGFSFEQLQQAVNENWGTDVIVDLLDPPATPPAGLPGENPDAGSPFVVIEDHFDKLEAFVTASPGIPFTRCRLADLRRHVGIPRYAVFHAAPDRDTTSSVYKRLQQHWPSSRKVAVVARHQGHQVSYLLEWGASRCLVEDIYPNEFNRLLSSDA